MSFIYFFSPVCVWCAAGWAPRADPPIAARFAACSHDPWSVDSWSAQTFRDGGADKKGAWWLQVGRYLCIDDPWIYSWGARAESESTAGYKQIGKHHVLIIPIELLEPHSGTRNFFFADRACKKMALPRENSNRTRARKEWMRSSNFILADFRIKRLAWNTECESLRQNSLSMEFFLFHFPVHWMSLSHVSPFVPLVVRSSHRLLCVVGAGHLPFLSSRRVKRS